ncbi:MAG: AAA family ATPase [Clostridia bacterium]|nr:AAA family ATPase [Clostridia bacterium]
MDYKDTEQKYKVLKNVIEDKKSKIKKYKKSEVAKDIKKYLDESKFAIIFKEQIINGEMEDILSDGEKSIIALCYYLASIHLLVEKESDYSKICYIIDDPISSMDFSYVFCVSRLIDTFCKADNTTRNPVIVLTHNLEFMNILIKNKIIDLKYILSQSHISTLSKELISPYEHHLIDIINISKNGTSPTHTTANSLRYLIESIWKFIKPDLQNVEEFILQEELFKNNEYIITIINDFSHGAIRQEIGYTDEQIKNACDCLVYYIEKNFPRQIKLIENQL